MILQQSKRDLFPHAVILNGQDIIFDGSIHHGSKLTSFLNSNKEYTELLCNVFAARTFAFKGSARLTLVGPAQYRLHINSAAAIVCSPHIVVDRLLRSIFTGKQW